MRRRIVLVVLATTSLVVVAFAVPLGALVRTVARDRALDAAERDTASLAPVLAVDPMPGSVLAAISSTTSGADGRLTVWLPDETMLGDRTPADDQDLALAAHRSFTRDHGGELQLYRPVVTGAGTSVVRARIPATLLNQGVGTAWAALAGVAVVLILAAVVIADRLARSVTRDATELSATARALAAGEVHARADPGPTPELADAARALNLLADRIDELRAAERERVADLSHRLRTPLTALRLDAEASGDAVLTADVERLEAAISELIRNARRPLHAGVVGAVCDLATVARDRADFWSALAEDDGRPWTFDGAPDGGGAPSRCRRRRRRPRSTPSSATSSPTPRRGRPTRCASVAPTGWSAWSSRTPVPGSRPPRSPSGAAPPAAGRPAWGSTSPAGPRRRAVVALPSTARRSAAPR